MLCELVVVIESIRNDWGRDDEDACSSASILSTFFWHGFLPRPSAPEGSTQQLVLVWACGRKRSINNREEPCLSQLLTATWQKKPYLDLERQEMLVLLFSGSSGLILQIELHWRAPSFMCQHIKILENKRNVDKINEDGILLYWNS